MIRLTYATGNIAKIESAKQFLNPLGIEVDNIKMDIPEIQADTNEEVAIFSAKYAYEKVEHMVLKNDSGLVIPALKGFPGVYTGYVEETIGEEGILKLMEGLEGDDRNAYFIECLALAEDKDNVKVFVSKTEGKIAESSNGNFGWGYDKIFIANGSDMTLACYEDEERYSKWSNEGYIKLAEYLNDKYKSR